MMHLDRYPRTVKCRKNLKIVIRPLQEEDLDSLEELFSELDDQALAKLPYDVRNINYARKIRRQMEDGTAYRLLAWHNDKVVGQLAMYRSSSMWVRHTASLVFIVHPDYRRYGIATHLFDEMIPLAESLGLEKVYAHMTKDHKAGIRMLKEIGFRREATLRDHVKDKYGRYKNLRIYAIDLEEAHKAMEEHLANFGDYSG